MSIEKRISDLEQQAKQLPKAGGPTYDWSKLSPEEMKEYLGICDEAAGDWKKLSTPQLRRLRELAIKALVPSGTGGN